MAAVEQPVEAVAQAAPVATEAQAAPVAEAQPEAQPVVEQEAYAEEAYAEGKNQEAQAAAPASGKMTGKCKWFNNSRGYGFIEGTDGKDYFVHQTSIKAQGYKSLKEGEDLEFDLLHEDGRVKAVNVTGPGGVDVQGNPGARGAGGGGGRSNVCFAWQKGHCDRGASCRFAHAEDGGGGGGYDQGGYDQGGYGGGGGGGGYGGGGYSGGGYGGGGYSGGGGRSRGVCYAWQRGDCFRGESCKFAHEEDGGGGGGGGGAPRMGGGRGGGGMGGRGVCYAWQRGECYRGDSCRFQHQETE